MHEALLREFQLPMPLADHLLPHRDSGHRDRGREGGVVLEEEPAEVKRG
jgi:hypothetical protein